MTNLKTLYKTWLVLSGLVKSWFFWPAIKAVTYDKQLVKIEIDWRLRVSLSGQLGKLGLKINGGRDRPCVPGDPGIFITTVKQGSVLDKFIGPGDKILKVFILKNLSLISCYCFQFCALGTCTCLQILYVPARQQLTSFDLALSQLSLFDSFSCLLFFKLGKILSFRWCFH